MTAITEVTVLDGLQTARGVGDGWRSVSDLAQDVYPSSVHPSESHLSVRRRTPTHLEDLRRTLRALARKGLVETIMWKDLAPRHRSIGHQEEPHTVLVRLVAGDRPDRRSPR